MSWANIILGGVAGGLGGLVHQVIKRRTGRPRLAEIVGAVVFGALEICGQVFVIPPYERREAVAQVDESLRTLPPFLALKEADPAAFADLQAGIEAAAGKRQSSSAITITTRAKVSALVGVYVPQASDTDVIAFFDCVIADVKAMEARDSSVAFSFLFPLPGDVVDTSKYLSEDERNRLLDAMAAVIRSGSAHSAPKPDPERASALLKSVLTPLAPTKGAGLKAMAAPHAAGVDKAGVVAAVVAMYEATLRLPPADAALVLRHLMGKGDTR